MSNLSNLSDKATCYDYCVNIRDSSLFLFKPFKSVSSREVKSLCKNVFGAGYTKLFVLKEMTTGRFSYVEVMEKSHDLLPLQ